MNFRYSDLQWLIHLKCVFGVVHEYFYKKLSLFSFFSSNNFLLCSHVLAKILHLAKMAKEKVKILSLTDKFAFSLSPNLAFFPSDNRFWNQVINKFLFFYFRPHWANFFFNSVPNLFFFSVPKRLNNLLQIIILNLLVAPQTAMFLERTKFVI